MDYSLLPSLDYLNECFDVEFDNGTLRWKHRPESHFKTVEAQQASNKKFAGKKAGYKRVDGRPVVKVQQKIYLVSRIVYFMYHEIIPQSIYHVNNDFNDNSVSNLISKKAGDCVVPSDANAKNKHKRQYGIGVMYVKERKLFRALIRSKYYKMHIGYFTSEETAKLAYKTAKAFVMNSKEPVDLSIKENRQKVKRLVTQVLGKTASP